MIFTPDFLFPRKKFWAPSSRQKYRRFFASIQNQKMAFLTELIKIIRYCSWISFLFQTAIFQKPAIKYFFLLSVIGQKKDKMPIFLQIF